MSDIFNQIATSRLVAMVIIDDAEDGAPLANTLWKNGITTMEVALRTAHSHNAITEIRDAQPAMLVGAGTVLTPAMISEAAEAGAHFALAPGADPVVLEEALKVGLPFIPGIACPTDISVALRHDCKNMKFFPAHRLGGLNYLRDITTPFLHLFPRFLPLGGLTLETGLEYLADPLIFAIGGSWIAPRELIQSRDWQAIGARASAASSAVRQTSPDLR